MGAIAIDTAPDTLVVMAVEPQPEEETSIDSIPQPEVVIVETTTTAIHNVPIVRLEQEPPVTETRLDTIVSDSGDLIEPPVAEVMIDTIPVQWVKDTTKIYSPQDTVVVAITDPDTLMVLRQYNLAAQYWKLEKLQNMDHFTIVLMYACSGATVDSAKNILSNPNDMFILPKDVDNRSCYIVCWGDFETRKQAEERFTMVPNWFAQNGLVPMVRPLFKIDRLTRLSLTRLIIENDHIKRE